MPEQRTRITRRATLAIGASLVAGYGLRARPALAQTARTEGEVVFAGYGGTFEQFARNDSSRPSRSRPASRSASSSALR